MGEVVLEIPAKPEYLAVARQVVVAAASVEPAFRDTRLDDLRIAVSEATTNAIAAHGPVSDERILIRCNLADDRVEVEVVDRGPGFDPTSTAAAPHPEHPDRLDWEGGLGLPLMRDLTDETEISSGARGTAVRLTVSVPRARRPPAPGDGPAAHAGRGVADEGGVEEPDPDPA
jgi:serine/threonine-protein kinase RsbW